MPKIVYTQEYNRKEFSPAMPVLEIGVSRAGRDRPAITIEAVIDSGSDGTLIPLDYLERADAQYIDRTFIRGVTGHRQSIDLYLVTIHIGAYRVHAVRAGALPENSQTLLGRDVLNQLNIMLNGLASVTDVFE